MIFATDNQLVRRGIGVWTSVCVMFPLAGGAVGRLHLAVMPEEAFKSYANSNIH